MKNIVKSFVLVTLLSAEVFGVNSIRVSTFSKEEGAARNLQLVKEYIKKQKFLTEQDYKIQAKTLKLGAYYVNVIEPIKGEDAKYIFSKVKESYTTAYQKRVELSLEYKHTLNKPLKVTKIVKKEEQLVKPIEVIKVKKDVVKPQIEKKKEVVLEVKKPSKKDLIQ